MEHRKVLSLILNLEDSETRVAKGIAQFSVLTWKDKLVISVKTKKPWRNEARECASHCAK